MAVQTLPDNMLKDTTGPDAYSGRSHGAYNVTMAIVTTASVFAQGLLFINSLIGILVPFQNTLGDE